MMRIVRNAKFREVLERDMLKRKLLKGLKLGARYLIADAVGSEALKVALTTSGPLIGLGQASL